MAIRNWRFVTGGITYTSGDTDLFVKYGQSGDPPIFNVFVSSVWERAEGASWRIKRKVIEDRMEALSGAQGKTGTLTIDAGIVGYEKSFSNIKLESCEPTQYDNNLMVEYDLVFGYLPLGNVARRLLLTQYDNGTSEPLGTTTMINTDVMLIYHDPPVDNTMFVKPWRNIPIRVPDAPGLSTIRCTGIRAQIATQSPDTALKRRRAVEELIRSMATLKGKQYTLTIDGNEATNPTPLVIATYCHLSDIVVSKIDLPDAAVFDMIFFTGYGQ